LKWNQVLTGLQSQPTPDDAILGLESQPTPDDAILGLSQAPKEEAEAALFDHNLRAPMLRRSMVVHKHLNLISGSEPALKSVVYWLGMIATEGHRKKLFLAGFQDVNPNPNPNPNP